MIRLFRRVKLHFSSLGCPGLKSSGAVFCCRFFRGFASKALLLHKEPMK